MRVPIIIHGNTFTINPNIFIHFESHHGEIRIVPSNVMLYTVSNTKFYMSLFLEIIAPIIDLYGYYNNNTIVY